VLVADEYPFPKPKDLMAQLAGRKSFSKLQPSTSAFDNDSHKYVTINTHQGLYQYTRILFGVASAPASFQNIMDTILYSIPHTICY